ncbi:hypothetical protein JAAARDRAFT_344407 [Jaapia argillacea MUCL 33604]|uniref:Uncharacterized protein n=1 Tax=Jaapia argillacea MUCL 33604 TaxID=933084 RepID=A0A067PK60_9AGAM|nr:hypothetical protein JAAARDRAFT_344407 [Jaapia argillacea MUCL 33604]
MTTPTVVDSYKFGALHFQLLRVSSSCAQHPTATINAPPGSVILGGGAFVDWTGPCASINPAGNLLTAMYPNDQGTSWTVASKDHDVPSPASISAYIVAATLRDGLPIPAEYYKVVSVTSAKAQHPTATATLPDGFVVVGGGAKANWTGDGNLLYGSYPSPDGRGWIGASKDHAHPDPSTITVWAIGLKKSFLSDASMTVNFFTRQDLSPAPANHPKLTFVVPDFHITGGGALVHWNGFGSLLTACFPQDRQSWVAAAKDHEQPDPATITIWTIGFTVDSTRFN